VVILLIIITVSVLLVLGVLRDFGIISPTLWKVAAHPLIPSPFSRVRGKHAHLRACPVCVRASAHAVHAAGHMRLRMQVAGPQFVTPK
jgi:hypothetical protein